MGVEAELQSDLENLDGYAQDIRSDLDQEILDRQSAVSSEASARIAGDSALQSSLNSEISRAQSAESQLRSDLSAEVSARQSAVSTEEAARIAGDQNLQSQINNIISNVDPSALDSLTEIVAAFQSADGSLENTITALGTASQSALAAEVSRATLAEQGLQSDIDAEVSAREQADSDLQSQITSNFESLEMNISEAVEDLSSRIDQEVSDRTAADEQLQSNIDEKVAKSGDTMTGALLFEDGSGMTSEIYAGSVEIYGPEGQSSSYNYEQVFLDNGAGSTITMNAGLGIQVNNDGSPAMPENEFSLTTKAYVDQEVKVVSDALAEVQNYLGQQIDELNSWSWHSQVVELSSEQISNGVVLGQFGEIDIFTVKVFVGRLALHNGPDIDITVDGTSTGVLQFTSEFMSSEEAAEAGDFLFISFRCRQD
jgi:hypothetical protein